MSTSGTQSSVAVADAADVNRKVEEATGKQDWTSLKPEHPLSKFSSNLQSILEEAGHNEMYGVELHAPASEGTSPPHTTLIILQKFLRANANDLTLAEKQLTEALKWRKEYKPLDAVNEIFPAAKFGGLGYITTVHGAKETKKDSDVCIFNIYGAAAKDPKKTFGDTDAFVRWRVALQELSLAQLHLSTADKVIPDYGTGPDPYQAIQVHDYLSVSFFRQPGEIKASSSKIIDMFQRYYPETVSFKYFVNVPLVMQWMMAAMKAILSKDTIQKMTWMTYGSELHKYLGPNVPKEYGGEAAPLSETALTVKYDASEGEEKAVTTAIVPPPSETETAAHPVPTTTTEKVKPAHNGLNPESSVPSPAAPAVATAAAPEISGKPVESDAVVR